MAVDDKVIRQFSLIQALMSTRFGLTIDEILDTVDGYRDTFDRNNPTEVDSIARKFERDKAEIIRLGIRIQTRRPADSPNDNHGMRYVVDQSAYVLPDDVTFTRRDIALLNVAARAWQEGSLRTDATRALNKLRSLGIEPDDTMWGIRPRITGWSGLAEEFNELLLESRVVEFSYLKPGEEQAAVRTVAPLALAEWNGRWYLLGWDFDRDAERTFLLPRVTKRPRPLPGREYEAPAADYAKRLIDGLEALARDQHAIVRCVPGSDADFRLSARCGFDSPVQEVRIPFADPDVLADELMEFGMDIEVVEPENVRRLIRKRFERLAQAHGGA